MIDLSNNNVGPAGIAPFDFKLAYRSGQRRAYFKVSEGKSFVDKWAGPLSKKARNAGFKVGGYHFANSFTQNPIEQADFFIHSLGAAGFKTYGKFLVPVLDLEVGMPDADMGHWASAFIKRLKSKLGVQPLVYSYASFLQSCKWITPPAPLWLAAYGKNDGVEHDFWIPKPWTKAVAHQYTSRGRVPGMPGLIDVSHVVSGKACDVPVLPPV